MIHTLLHFHFKIGKVRGVTIIGEMDVPGHSSGIANVLPAVFGFPSQGQKQVGIVNLVNMSTIKALQTIFDEINAVFPSPYVHCGGDEVSFGTLDKLPEVQDAIKSFGFNSSTDVYRWFIAEMYEIAIFPCRMFITRCCWCCCCCYCCGCCCCRYCCCCCCCRRRRFCMVTVFVWYICA